jgi:hypothetical protein
MNRSADVPSALRARMSKAGGTPALLPVPGFKAQIGIRRILILIVILFLINQF